MKHQWISLPNQQGFSLIECAVVALVAALFLALAIPSYNSFLAQKRLRVGTEELYNYMKLAQAKSFNNHVNIYLSFNTAAAWCYGLSDTAPCSCETSNSCQVDGVETVINSTNYSGNALTLSTAGFATSGGSPYIQFNGARGTINASGSVNFGQSGLQTTINANTAGLISICSNNVSGFPSC